MSTPAVDLTKAYIRGNSTNSVRTQPTCLICLRRRPYFPPQSMPRILACHPILLLRRGF